LDNIERIKALEARPLATPSPTVVAAPVTSSVDSDKITALEKKFTESELERNMLKDKLERLEFTSKDRFESL